MEQNKYWKGCYIPEEDFLKYCKEIKRKSYYGFNKDQVKIILPNDTVVTPEEYWKSKEKKKGRWKPEYGEKYYFLNASGIVLQKKWCDDIYDNYRYLTNNIEKTKEKLEEKKKKELYQQQYRDYAEEHNDDICWENDQQYKYKAYYAHEYKQIFISDNRINKEQGAVYFTNEQDIYDFIKLIGEKEFKKYILEVNE